MFKISLDSMNDFFLKKIPNCLKLLSHCLFWRGKERNKGWRMYCKAVHEPYFTNDPIFRSWNERVLGSWVLLISWSLFVRHVSPRCWLWLMISLFCPSTLPRMNNIQAPHYCQNPNLTSTQAWVWHENDFANPTHHPQKLFRHF